MKMIAKSAAAGVVAFWAGISPAIAHHVMDGRLPDGLASGFLSGLGHPLIGLDHFAFVIAVGLMSLAFAGRYLLPLAFVAATAVGTAVHLARVDLPGAELLIAATVLLAGAALVRQMRLPVWALAALFAVTGLFHGYAYGESIVGAEATPLAAYLLGFCVIQYAVATAAMAAVRRLWMDEAARSTALRVVGGAVAGVGLVFLSGHLLPG